MSGEDTTQLHRRWLISAAALICFVGPVACTTGDPVLEPEPTAPEPAAEPEAQPEPEPTPEPDVVLPDSDNPLDVAMRDAFIDARHVPTPAGQTELCRRLFVDLVGQVPTAQQVTDLCADRTADELVTVLQQDPRYRRTAVRRWRDRFDTNDIVSDWRYLKGLYALVDDLHRGDLSYDEFAIEVLAHPGFTLTTFDAVERARNAFSVFLGREATDAEAYDFSGLFLPWLPSFVEDADYPPLYRTVAQISPYLCGVTSCSSSLLGDATLEFEGAGFDVQNWEDADPAWLVELRKPGERVVAQPYFYEAAADEILDRLLDWDNGAREPRRPGYLFPALREVLAQHIALTGDIPGAERLVLTSWLYTQTAVVDAGGDQDPPVFTTGPVKAMLGEVWLDNVLKGTELDFGACDPRYGDGYPYFLLYDAHENGELTLDQLEQSFISLNAEREDLMPLYLEFYGDTQIMQPDYRYRYFAQLLGGCPGFGTVRQTPEGLAYAFLQETVSVTLCDASFAENLAPAGPLNIAPVFDHQMSLFLSRPPTADEAADATAAFSPCDQCDGVQMVEDLCVSLHGSVPALFY